MSSESCCKKIDDLMHTYGRPNVHKRSLGEKCSVCGVRMDIEPVYHLVGCSKNCDSVNTIFHDTYNVIPKLSRRHCQNYNATAESPSLS